MSEHAEADEATWDLAPGVEAGGSGAKLLRYVAGLGLATVLTAASFWAAGTSLVWAPGVPILLAVLAIGQMGVHLVFFLHISSAPDHTNTFLALAFGCFVVGLIIFGSMFIIANMNMNMMPPDQLMQMQR